MGGMCALPSTKENEKKQRLLTEYHRNLLNMMTESDKEIMRRIGSRFRQNFTGTQSPSLLGLESIRQISNNFSSLIAKGRLRVLRCRAESDKCIKVQIENPGDDVTAELQAGTVLIPHRSFEEKFQTLIIKRSECRQVSAGVSNIEFETLCFQGQRFVPKHQDYRFGTVRASKYEEGMSEKQVWEITLKKQTFEIKAQNNLPCNSLALTPSEIRNLFDNWERYGPQLKSS